RHHVAAHVGDDLLDRPIVGIADAGAAAAELDHDVAGLDLRHAVRLDPDFLVSAQDDGAGARDRLPALGALGLDEIAVRAAGRHTAVAAFVERTPVDPAAAAPASGAVEVGARLKLEHPPGETDLRLLDGAALHRAERVQCGRAGHAVVSPHGTGAAVVIKCRAHVALAGARIDREGVVAAVLAPGGDGAVRLRLAQRLDDGFDDLAADIHRAGADRRWILAVGDRAGRCDP